jgi:hypothetical protein
MRVMSDAERERRRPARTQVPLSLPEDLADKVDAAAAEVGLSKQDTMRLALERGLPVLLAQLSAAVR